MKNIFALTLLFIVTSVGWAGSGGGLNSPGSTPLPSSPSPTTAAPTPVNAERTALVNQIELFTRSVLPAIISAENGDESVLPFLKDKISYADALKKQCEASKASGEVREVSTIIKKLELDDVSIDSVKKEAKINVLGQLVSSAKPAPESTLWIVSLKMNPAGAPQPFTIIKVLAAKIP
jgi:hypothetical protein